MKLVPRSYPLINIRPLISSPDYDPIDHLHTHGFGVVKSTSSFLANHKKEDITQDNLQAECYPEMIKLIKKTLGAKHVHIGASVLRQGKEVEEEFKVPVGLQAHNQGKAGEVKASGDFKKEGVLAAAKPIRTPHIDSTPLGARQFIRHDKVTAYNLALETGIIAAEDKIIEGKAFTAESEESNALIAQHYNGPRYAYFSVWRPLSTVGRDPIALCQRGDEEVFAEEYVHRPYSNKLPGAEELGGDYLKEFALLGVQREVPRNERYREGVKWYYVEKQRSDEVLFIKLFDSMALGDGGHMGAPYHASPEIGDVEGGQARSSLELRVFVFW